MYYCLKPNIYHLCSVCVLHHFQKSYSRKGSRSLDPEHFEHKMVHTWPRHFKPWDDDDDKHWIYLQIQEMYRCIQ